MSPEYKTDKIRFFKSDCNEFMKDKKDNEYDLAIVDPPYGIGINVNIGRRKKDKKSNYHKFIGEDKAIPDKLYFDMILSISNNQIIFGGNYMTNYLDPSPCWILWDKGFSEDVTFSQFEMAWTSFNSSTKKYDFNAAANRNRIHPTQKPVSLYEWILIKYAKENDKIIDTHGGSMSIAIAVHNINRELKMNLSLDICELDYDYFNAGVERFKKHINQMTIFD